MLAEARRGELPGMVRTGATFADAVAEYMRWLEQDRARKPTTLRGYESIMRAHLLPAFGERRLEDITAEEVEAWSAQLAARGAWRTRRGFASSRCLFGVMKRAKRVWKLPRNPIADVEKPVQSHAAIELEVFSPEEIHALVRAAESEQDAAIYLTAAFTGLRRGELVGAALALRSTSRGAPSASSASYSERALSTPKSGRARSVPMAPPVAEALARLASRGHDDQEDDLVFPGTFGEYLDGSALYRRYKAALEAGRPSAACASTTCATRSARR